MAFPSADLPERVQLLRPRRPKQSVPRIRPKSHDAGESSLNVAKLNGTKQRAEVSAERKDSFSMLWAWVYRNDQKDSCARKRRSHGLRKGANALCRLGL